MRKVLAGIAVIVASGGLAAGETPKQPPMPKGPPTTSPKVYTPKPAPPPHREGEYGGVVPGVKHDKPILPKKPGKGILSWIGFEAKDGGAQLFFQSVAPFEITQEVVGGSVYAYLALTSLGQNTWRQVDTRFFDNPLAGVVANKTRAAKATKGRAAHGAGIEVRITFKNPKDAREGTVRTATEADGMSYVYLSFPEGADAKGAPTISEPEK